MSDIRFNRWLHQSGTGGVYQDSSGNIGIGTSVPTTKVDIQGGDIKIGGNVLSSSGVSTFTTVNATTLTGNLTGDVTGNVTGNVTGGITTSQITVGDSFLKSGAVGLGTTDTTGRNAGVGTAVGTIIYNETAGAVQIYKRITGWQNIDNVGDDAAAGITATGGIIADYTDPGPGNTYRAHIFTSSGTFEITALANGLPNALEYVVIGGGGGGGNSRGGGGGAGGYRSSVQGESSGGGATAESVITGAVQSYPVVVGGGGYYFPSPSAPACRGNPSSFGPITSHGGGYGRTDDEDGINGGSGGGAGGGGAGWSPGVGGAANFDPAGNPVTAQGYPGGNKGNNNNGPNAGAGGGGAGGAGGPAEDPAPNTSKGGAGVPSYISGEDVVRASGGSGGTQPAGSIVPGTPGGGGDGGFSHQEPFNGRSGTGGGGGGGGYTGSGGMGGSGFVAVRYQIAPGDTNTAKATGGSVSFYNGKTIHTFTGSGTFATPSSFGETCEYVVIAGGGSGGSISGGGGGAGGYRLGTTPIGSSQTVSITVGGGAARVFSNPQGRLSGSPTVVNFPAGTITSAGGGGGGNYNSASGDNGESGGSGGGGSGQSGGSGGAGDTPPTSPPQGNAGGTGVDAGANHFGGGGGGAGSAGLAGNAGTGASFGGEAVQLPATFRNPVSAVAYGRPGPGGSSFWVAGGGGGARGGAPNLVSGGTGATVTYNISYGGAGMGGYPGNDPGTDALSNTGSGGGGGRYVGGGAGGYGGAGGSGIVIIAYPT